MHYIHIYKYTYLIQKKLKNKIRKYKKKLCNNHNQMISKVNLNAFHEIKLNKIFNPDYNFTILVERMQIKQKKKNRKLY